MNLRFFGTINRPPGFLNQLKEIFNVEWANEGCTHSSVTEPFFESRTVAHRKTTYVGYTFEIEGIEIFSDGSKNFSFDTPGKGGQLYIEETNIDEKKSTYRIEFSHVAPTISENWQAILQMIEMAAPTSFLSHITPIGNVPTSHFWWSVCPENPAFNPLWNESPYEWVKSQKSQNIKK